MKKIFLIPAILALTACAAGTTFDRDDAKTVKIGDTDTQLVKKMGTPPYRISSNGENDIYVWSYANGFTGSVGMVSFALTNGKVTAVPKFKDYNDD